MVSKDRICSLLLWECSLSPIDLLTLISLFYPLWCVYMWWFVCRLDMGVWKHVRCVKVWWRLFVIIKIVKSWTFCIRITYRERVPICLLWNGFVYKVINWCVHWSPQFSVEKCQNDKGPVFSLNCPQASSIGGENG